MSLFIVYEFIMVKKVDKCQLPCHSQGYQLPKKYIDGVYIIMLMFYELLSKMYWL